jgi:hypothetical protein
MNDRAFDPNSWFDAYREPFAPMIRAQQEGLKTFERFVRLNYDLAGDYLGAGLKQAEAVVSARNPADLVSRQAKLGSVWSEQLCARMQEFASMTADAQSAFAHFTGEAASRASETVSRAASQAGESVSRAASEAGDSLSRAASHAHSQRSSGERSGERKPGASA